MELNVSSPVLGALQPQVPSVLRVEAGQEQVGIGPGRGGGGFLIRAGARAGGVGIERTAETHPDGVGGPVGTSGGWQGKTASSDQNQLVARALPPHRLGCVETAAEQTICRKLWFAKAERAQSMTKRATSTFDVCILSYPSPEMWTWTGWSL